MTEELKNSPKREGMGEPLNNITSNEPQVSPEIRDQLACLRSGDPVAVKNTLLGAFQHDCQNGFDFLVAACIIVPDTPMCERLIRVLHDLVHYQPFVQFASCAFTEIIGHTPSNQIRRTAVAAMGERMFSNPSFDDLAPPAFTAAARKHIRSRIVEMTTGTETTIETTSEPPVQLKKKPSAIRQKQVKAKPKRRHKQSLTQAQEQMIGVSDEMPTTVQNHIAR